MQTNEIESPADLPARSKRLLLSHSHLEKMCYRLGAALKAGIPLAEAWGDEMRLLRGRTRRSFEQVHQQLEEGGTLADALTAEPCFPAMLTEMVRVGEETGALDQTFLQMADHYRALVRMKRTFLHGITWPLLQAMAAAVVISLFFVVLYVLQTRIEGLTAPDVFMLGLSPLGNLGLFWAVLTIVMLTGYLLVRGIRSGWFGSLPMRMALAIPLLGSTIKSLALSRFAWAFGTAVDAGMNAQKAIQLGLRSTQNRFYQKHEPEIVTSVSGGKDFFTSMKQTDAFPTDLMQAVQSGERTGKLTESLERLSEDYREESALNLRRIGQLSGFGIFITVGAMMGFAILFMYASYLGTLSDALKGQSITLEQIRQGQQVETTNPVIAQRNEMVKDFVENNEDFKQIESIYNVLGRFDEMTPDEFLDAIVTEPTPQARKTDP